MLQKNISTCIIRSLVSFGIVLSNLTLTEIFAVSAQSSDPDRGIECIKKYSEFYYSRQGGDLSRADALAKAEKTCAEQSQQPTRRNDEPREPRNDNSGGSPEAIASCMQKLMYERKPVCTRSDCARLSSPEENANNSFGGWQWQTVRTSTSENAAVRACREAR
jgi:hypothetical protein